MPGIGTISTVNETFLNVSPFNVTLLEVAFSYEETLIYKHHIKPIDERRAYYSTSGYLEENTFDDIVCDYIASMTDDYFVDLCTHLLPDAPKITYIGYFE